MESKGTLLLKRSELASLMSLQEYIEGIENAFRMRGKGLTFGTGMVQGDTLSETEFHIKVGGLKLGENSYYGLKINGSNFNNMKKYGLPNIMGAIVLFDATKAIPLAIIDSGDPTVKRTGAATAVAAKFLARKDSKIVSICGSGTQGRIQLRCLKIVFPDIHKAYAYDMNSVASEEYAESMSKELNIEVIPTQDLSNTISRSDIIVTCTPSRKPYLLKEYVNPGTFIAAVGADSPDKQELEETLLSENKVVVDILEQCAVAGELHHALEAGLMTTKDVNGELGDVLAGKKPGRISDDEIIIYDATGTALQDTAAAALCYEKAVERGMGIYLNFFQ